MPSYSNREVVLTALKKGRAAGTVSRRQYFIARVVSRIAPRKFDDVCDSIVETAKETVIDDAAYGDLENIENILKLLMEYLPQIIELVMSIFSLFSNKEN